MREKKRIGREWMPVCVWVREKHTEKKIEYLNNLAEKLRKVKQDKKNTKKMRDNNIVLKKML